MAAVVAVSIAGCDTAGRVAGDPETAAPPPEGAITLESTPPEEPDPESMALAREREAEAARAAAPPTRVPPKKPDFESKAPAGKGKAQVAREAAPPPAVPPERSGPDSRALIGKSETELARLLGAPNDVRNEPPAVVWSYRSEACSLDVFLYFDVGQNGFRSLAYRFYPETRVEKVERACLAGIREDRAQRPKPD